MANIPSCVDWDERCPECQGGTKYRETLRAGPESEIDRYHCKMCGIKLELQRWSDETWMLSEEGDIAPVYIPRHKNFKR